MRLALILGGFCLAGPFTGAGFAQDAPGEAERRAAESIVEKTRASGAGAIDPRQLDAAERSALDRISAATPKDNQDAGLKELGRAAAMAQPLGRAPEQPVERPAPTEYPPVRDSAVDAGKSERDKPGADKADARPEDGSEPKARTDAAKTGASKTDADDPDAVDKEKPAALPVDPSAPRTLTFAARPAPMPSRELPVLGEIPASSGRTNGFEPPRPARATRFEPVATPSLPKVGSPAAPQAVASTSSFAPLDRAPRRAPLPRIVSDPLATP